MMLRVEQDLEVSGRLDSLQRGDSILYGSLRSVEGRLPLQIQDEEDGSRHKQDHHNEPGPARSCSVAAARWVVFVRDHELFMVAEQWAVYFRHEGTRSVACIGRREV